MQWQVYIEIECEHDKLDEICQLLNNHPSVTSAKPVIEEAEQVKGGAPIINRSSLSSIICNAIILHQWEEEDLRRLVEKLRMLTKDFQFHSEKRKALRKHIMLTAGLTAAILFTVVMGDQIILLVTVGERPITVVQSLSVAIVAATAAFLIEALIIVKEHNV